MKKWIQVLIGIAVAVVLLWVVSRIAGLLFWGGLVLILVAALSFWMRRWLKKTDPLQDPDRLLEEKTEDEVDRLIKEMERLAGKS